MPESASPGRSYRRVVTGHDAEGRSICAIDERTQESPGWLHNLWFTDPGPVDNRNPSDCLGPDRRTALAPAPGGSLFRICLVPPRSYIESLSEADIRSIFASLDAPSARREGASHRLMHATETVDYIVVLQGRVTLHLEGGDVELGPVDTVVQRGTSHGWTNQSDEWAALAVAMVGAIPLNRPGSESR